MKTFLFIIYIVCTVGFWISLSFVMAEIAQIFRIDLNCENRSSNYFMRVADFFILSPKWFKWANKELASGKVK